MKTTRLSEAHGDPSWQAVEPPEEPPSPEVSPSLCMAGLAEPRQPHPAGAQKTPDLGPTCPQGRWGLELGFL